MPCSIQDMDEPKTPHRRALLTLGAAVLVGGCGTRPPASTPKPASSGRRRVQPSRELQAKCVHPTKGELHGLTIQSHVRCGAADTAPTIDDGPDPTWTPKVLALLASPRIRATRSVVGSHAKVHPGLV